MEDNGKNRVPDKKMEKVTGGTNVPRVTPHEYDDDTQQQAGVDERIPFLGILKNKGWNS